jgi:hypothetical protein
MPRTCTICSHDESHAINVALVSREPYRTIADRYGVSQSALKRHSAEHIPELLAKSKEAVESAEADDLLAELEAIKADVARLKDKAEDEGDLRTALTGCDKALKALEFQAKVSQIIDERPQINLNLSAEWLEVRGLILWALEPHQEARESVLAALEAQSNGKVWDGA